ncbi:MAG: hypothetical protein II393_00975 [Cytophagales bacterium]|nr:hypothetical protein [Cytophagales bacterium]
MRNKIKHLLLNLLLLSVVYCSWECEYCSRFCVNNEKNEYIENKNNEENDQEQHDLYFTIKSHPLNGGLLKKCFGDGWSVQYLKKKESISLYEIEKQQKLKEEAAGTLVLSKDGEELGYTGGNGLPDDIKIDDNKWAIVEITTIDIQKKKKEKRR